MEGEKILLILVLFLGLSLAAEVPRFFRDKPVPNKLRLGLWRKYKATDQHQSQDIRTMTDTKQIEESSDVEVRHKLPIQDTAWFSHENDDASPTPYCRYKYGVKYFPGTLEKKVDETFCDPADLPSDQIVMIDQVAHQRCEMQFPQYYCFTKEEKVTVHYRIRKNRSYEYKSEETTARTGCVCATQNVRKR